MPDPTEQGPQDGRVQSAAGWVAEDGPGLLGRFWDGTKRTFRSLNASGSQGWSWFAGGMSALVGAAIGGKLINNILGTLGFDKGIVGRILKPLATLALAVGIFKWVSDKGTVNSDQAIQDRLAQRDVPTTDRGMPISASPQPGQRREYDSRAEARRGTEQKIDDHLQEYEERQQGVREERSRDMASRRQETPARSGREEGGEGDDRRRDHERDTRRAVGAVVAGSVLGMPGAGRLGAQVFAGDDMASRRREMRREDRERQREETAGRDYTLGDKRVLAPEFEAEAAGAARAPAGAAVQDPAVKEQESPSLPKGTQLGPPPAP